MASFQLPEALWGPMPCPPSLHQPGRAAIATAPWIAAVAASSLITTPCPPRGCHARWAWGAPASYLGVLILYQPVVKSQLSCRLPLVRGAFTGAAFHPS